jgi:hypothetical protein
VHKPELTYFEKPHVYSAYANGNVSIPHSYRRPKTFERSVGLLDNFKGRRDHKKKTYVLTNQSRKVFMSRAIVAQLRSRRKMTTMLLTYPEQKIVKDPYQDLNRFITNLRKTYGLKFYLSALELTKKNQWHFHLLVDMPWYNPEDIKRAWNSAAGFESNNSVRDMRKIQSAAGAIAYCAAYLKKESQKYHEKRKFSYSKNLVNTEKIEIDENDLYTDQIKVVSKTRFEYCTVLKVVLNDAYLTYFKQQKHVKNTYKPPENTYKHVKNTCIIPEYTLFS